MEREVLLMFKDHDVVVYIHELERPIFGYLKVVGELTVVVQNNKEPYDLQTIPISEIENVKDNFKTLQNQTREEVMYSERERTD